LGTTSLCKAALSKLGLVCFIQMRESFQMIIRQTFFLTKEKTSLGIILLIGILSSFFRPASLKRPSWSETDAVKMQNLRSFAFNFSYINTFIGATICAFENQMIKICTATWHMAIASAYRTEDPGSNPPAY
jgi:hypothetical protein